MVGKNSHNVDMKTPFLLTRANARNPKNLKMARRVRAMNTKRVDPKKRAGLASCYRMMNFYSTDEKSRRGRGYAFQLYKVLTENWP